MSTKKEIKEFAEKFHVTFPVGQENGIAEALGAEGIPETIFIAEDGRIVKRITDTIHYSELESGIREILEQPSR
jgi:hypothetical protein